MPFKCLTPSKIIMRMKSWFIRSDRKSYIFINIFACAWNAFVVCTAAVAAQFGRDSFINHFERCTLLNQLLLVIVFDVNRTHDSNNQHYNFSCSTVASNRNSFVSWICKRMSDQYNNNKSVPNKAWLTHFWKMFGSTGATTTYTDTSKNVRRKDQKQKHN